MKALKNVMVLAVKAVSLSAMADGRSYECGTLEDKHGCKPRPFVRYLVHVSDGLVGLETVHGTPKGMNYSTNATMNLIETTETSESYYAQGLTAKFESKLDGHTVTNVLTLSDKLGNSAICH